MDKPQEGISGAMSKAIVEQDAKIERLRRELSEVREHLRMPAHCGFPLIPPGVPDMKLVMVPHDWYQKAWMLGHYEKCNHKELEGYQ